MNTVWVLVLTASWLPGPMAVETYGTRRECELRINQEKLQLGWLEPGLREIVFTCVEVLE